MDDKNNVYLQITTMNDLKTDSYEKLYGTSAVCVVCHLLSLW